MSVILDLIIVAILIIFTILAAKKGFVKSVVEVAGFVLAIFLAFTFSTPVTNFIYEKAVNPAIHSTVEAAVGNTYSNIDSSVTDAVTEKLPGFIANNMDALSIDLTGILSDNYGSPSEVADAVCDNVVRPVITSILSSVITVLLLIILMIAFRFLAKFINKIFSFSIIGTANKLLGAAIGLVKGAGVAVIFVLVVTFIISLTGGFFVFTKEYADSSVLFRFISGILPFNF